MRTFRRSKVTADVRESSSEIIKLWGSVLCEFKPGPVHLCLREGFKNLSQGKIPLIFIR